MCKYSNICPVFDKRSDLCNSDTFCRGTEKCIPLLLEWYHCEKQTPFDDIKTVLYQDVEGN